jgi:hypothetical protein
LGILSAVIVVAGCAPPQRKVFKTWRGDPIGQSRTNEKVFLSPPELGAISDAQEPGYLRIDTKQKQVTTFDLEERYEKVGVVRDLSPEQVERLKADAAKSANVGLVLGGTWLFPPLGATLTAGAAAMDRKKTKQRNEAEKAALQRITEGESEVSATLNYRWSSVHAQYKREVIGEEVEPAGPGTEEAEVVAARVPLKIENLQYPAQQTKAYTDDAGSVSFSLARTLAEAAALKPGHWKVSAKWKGKWREVGTVEITPEWIEQVVRTFREQKLYATGESELPPAAAMSLKVSNGRLQAGMESDISLTVLNTGQGTFYRLTAVTESEIPALDGLKFDFGKLSSGEGLSLVHRISLPRRQPPGQAAVRFRWTELNDYAPIDVDAQIPIVQ